MAEGARTEADYLSRFDEHTHVSVQIPRPDNKSSPTHLVKRMQRALNKQSLRANDSAWILLDRDSWSEQAIEAAEEWARSDQQFNVAISNPKFELWLLLHFEAGRELSASEIDRRLRTYLPNYHKQFDPRWCSDQSVLDAIDRAKALEMGNHASGPRLLYGTQVYRLVKRILAMPG